jgi:hypothetical protein
MIHTIRILYPGIHSRVGGYISATLQTLVWPPIHRDSIVLISASEYRTLGIQGGTPVIDRYLGDAEVIVSNIAPEEGIVSFYITVDWKAPLNIAVDFVIIDPPGLMVDAGSGAVYPLASAMLSQQALQFVGKHLSTAKLKEFHRRVVTKAAPTAKVRTPGNKAKVPKATKKAKRRS